MDNNIKSDRPSKNFSIIGIIYLIGVAFSLFVQYLSANLVYAYNSDFISSGTGYLVSVMVPLFVIGYPVFILLVTRYKKTYRLEEHKMSLSQFFIAFLMAYSIIFVFNIVSNIVIGGLTAVTGFPAYDTLSSIMDDTNIYIQLIFAVIIAPIYEELIFRKLLIDRIVRWGELPAIILSGVMFGLFHGDISQGIYAMALGAFFAYIYVRTGRLRYSVGLHALINFLGSVVASLVSNNINAKIIASGDGTAIMNDFAANPTSYFIYALYCIMIMLFVIGGIVFFIINRKNFFVKPVEGELHRGNRFKTTVINPGMIIYIVGTVAYIVVTIWMNKSIF